jgi:heme exporter protein D
MIYIVLVILVAAIILNSYMTRREAIRRENEHDRREGRFERLMNQLQKPDSDKNDDPDNYRESETKKNDKP